MRPELEALRAALAALGRSAFLVDVPAEKPAGWTGAYPPAAYYVVEPVGAVRPDDVPVSGGTSAWSAPVRVKAVGVTAEQVMTHLSDARDALCPDGRPGALTVSGRGVVVVFVRHEAVFADRDVSPRKYVAVDTVRVESVPA